MKTYYKLTDKDGYTRRGNSNETKWGEHIRYIAIGGGHKLCSDGYIHAYESPEIAVFMNPAQGRYDPDTMLLWECHLHGGVKKDGQLELGARSCTTIRKIPLLVITLEQRITVAIKASLLVYHDDAYIKWAHAWLSGADRTAESAARAVARSAESPARWVASAESAAAWSVASAARWVAAAESAAARAARAAESAARSGQAQIDLLSIIRATIA